MGGGRCLKDKSRSTSLLHDHFINNTTLPARRFHALIDPIILVTMADRISNPELKKVSCKVPVMSKSLRMRESAMLIIHLPLTCCSACKRYWSTLFVICGYLSFASRNGRPARSSSIASNNVVDNPLLQIRCINLDSTRTMPLRPRRPLAGCSFAVHGPPRHDRHSSRSKTIRCPSRIRHLLESGRRRGIRGVGCGRTEILWSGGEFRVSLLEVFLERRMCDVGVASRKDEV